VRPGLAGPVQPGWVLTLVGRSVLPFVNLTPGRWSEDGGGAGYLPDDLVAGSDRMGSNCTLSMRGVPVRGLPQVDGGSKSRAMDAYKGNSANLMGTHKGLTEEGKKVLRDSPSTEQGLRKLDGGENGWDGESDGG
jgi:hypothetical protein